MGKTILKITHRHVVAETDKKYIWLQLLSLHLCRLIHYQINTFIERQIFSQQSKKIGCFAICEISFQFLMDSFCLLIYIWLCGHLMWFGSQLYEEIRLEMNINEQINTTYQYLPGMNLKSSYPCFLECMIWNEWLFTYFPDSFVMF